MLQGKPSQPGCSSRSAQQSLAGRLEAPVLRLSNQGGQLVTHVGAPIVVSLANEAISFGCKISYPHSPELKDFTAWYFHVDLQSQRSSEKQINCSSHPVQENQMHSLQCWVTPQLPNASATGTYYCSVHWPNLIRISKGIFILVRDTGYREPPQGAQKLLLFCFTGLLTLLSILVTALLLWKKGQMRAPPKRLDPGTAHRQEKPVAESIYTSLQGRDTEIYSCIQTVPSSLPPNPDPVSQEKMHRFTNDSEFNLVYENL
ncbi:NFAT activation molecule 1 isoform X1 [Leopardus geoffroyi]|uniref:NFAT activation molecule 1 isoform X1 n=1 Tax=Leopardus geoffroyi TaxID=46844 RepID=UPI001E2624B8|nr:NFAT activation molecule 1 isoform X1 [Leopardus geoffroyi]